LPGSQPSWTVMYANSEPPMIELAKKHYEQAVILGGEREALDGMIAQAMARHGLWMPELSRKAQQKQVARWRRRH